MTVDPTIALALKIFFGLFFFVSAVHKMQNFADFGSTVAAYLGYRGNRRFIHLVAGTIVSIELAACLSSLSPYFASVGSVIVTGLLLSYALLMWVNILVGRTTIDCGCSWSEKGTVIGYPLVVRNLILGGLSSTFLLGQTDRVLTSLDYVTAAFCAAAALVIYLMSEYLVSNDQSLLSTAQRI